MNFNDELTLLLKARYPIIYINTIEEDRVEYIIRKSIKTNLNRSIYSWDFVDGYTNNPNNEGFAKKNPWGSISFGVWGWSGAGTLEAGPGVVFRNF